MAGTVTVVKQIFAIGVVYRQHRKGKLPGRLAGLVAQHSSGGLFTSSPDLSDMLSLRAMQMVYQIAAIINYDVRPDIQSRQLMLLELLLCGIIPGIHVQPF